jgi:hypothetical protein
MQELLQRFQWRSFYKDISNGTMGEFYAIVPEHLQRFQWKSFYKDIQWDNGSNLLQ